MNDYIVKKAVPIGGRKRKPGETVTLSDRQALYLVTAGKVEKAPKQPTQKSAKKASEKSVNKEATDA